MTSYRVQRTADGSVSKTVTGPAGTATTTVTGNDGSTTTTRPDGTRLTSTAGPDPRFGMEAPVMLASTQTLPSGRRSATEMRREVTLADPADQLSVRRLADTMTVNGRVSTRDWDGTLLRFVDTSPSGRRVTTDVDAQRRPLREAVEGLTPTVYTYDADGRPLTVGKGARITTSAYDQRGRTASTTDAAGRTTSYAYDLADRLTRETLHDGREIVHTHDAHGNPTSLTPPGRGAHAYTYTSRDLTSSYVPPALPTGPTPTLYAYDDDLHPTRVTRADGRHIDFAYDAGGRLESLTQAGRTSQFTYDPQTGHPASSTAPGGDRIAFAFDGGLPTRWTYTGTAPGEVSRTYDDDFQVSSESVDDESPVSLSYDVDGLLTRAGDLSLTRDGDNGLVTAMSLASTSTAIARNDMGEAQAVTTHHAGTPLYSESYTRDDLGRIATKTEVRGASTSTLAYSYDVADRLERVSRDGVLQTAYRYDVNGNRTEVTRGAGLPIAATYDAQDRLTGFGVTDYSYADTGELSAKHDAQSGDTTTYDYDSLGALTGASLPDGTAIEYVIDANGRRIAKKRDGQVVQRFVYGPGQNPLAELNADGTVGSRFVYATGFGAPEYMIRGAQRYRIVTDQLGSPRVVFDADTGAVMQELDYDEFGRVTADTNPGFQPFGFAGGLYDADTKLVRFGVRDYDAETGRFTAPDPVGFDGGDTNLYAYVMNDPVNLVDPPGLGWQEAGDFFAGFGDTLTAPLGWVGLPTTRDVREWMGTNDAVNFCSGWYSAGEWAGVGTSFLLGGAGGLRAAGAKGLGKEFSHWIPNRKLKDLGTGLSKTFGRSRFNGNYVSPMRHYKHDPFRYPRGWRNAGPRFNPVVRQLDRVPRVYYGGAAGAGWGGGGAASNSDCCP